MKRLLFISLCCLSISSIFSQEKEGKKKKEGKQSVVSYFNFPDQGNREYSDYHSFKEYQGLIIERINVHVLDRQLDPIGQNDSLSLTVQNKLNVKEKFNKKIIYNQLHFEVGDTIDPFLFADCEKNIRTLTVYKDAILVISPTSDSTGIVNAYIQDNRHWRMIFNLSPTYLRLGVGFRDFGGLSQSIEIYGQGNIDIDDPYGFNVEHGLYNMGGKHIDFENTYLRSNKFQTITSTLFRDFYAYNTNWAGKAQVVFSQEKYALDGFSSEYDLGYVVGDFWLARSFALKNFGTKKPTMRMIMSARTLLQKFTETPNISDTLRFVDRQAYIGGIGLANREWYGVEELYEFREYQYVPKGFNLSFLAGFEKDEYLGDRWYSGVKANYNRMYPNFGYLQTKVSYGAFVRNRDYEQITFQLINRYFSKQVAMGKFGFRQFIHTDFTISYDRPFKEFYDISEGISGLGGERLIATKSAILNLESVIYTPLKWWTTRANIFVFADLGWTTRTDYDFLLNNTLYQGYGFGIRFQNLKTTIDFMEISFGFYPNGKHIDAPITNFNISTSPSRIIIDENLFSNEVLDDVY